MHDFHITALRTFGGPATKPAAPQKKFEFRASVNGRRAQRGKAVVRKYAELESSSCTTPVKVGEETMIDTIADCLHAADQMRLDTEAVLRMAINNWRAER